MASGLKFRFDSNRDLDWIFRDDFLGFGNSLLNTNLSAPGPGAVYTNVVGSSGDIKEWYFDGVVTDRDQYWLWSGAIGRAVGRVFIFKGVRWTYNDLDFNFGLVPAVNSSQNIYLDNSDTGPDRNDPIFAIGGNDTGQASLMEWRQLLSGYWWPYYVNPAAVDQSAVDLAGDGYTFAVVLLDAGHIVYVLDGSGEWRFFTHNRSSTAEYMHMAAHHGSSELWFKSWRVIDSPGLDNLDSIDGWAADYSLGHLEAVGSNPISLSSDADLAFSLLVETLPAAAQDVEIRFRIQDSSNYLRLTIASTGAVDVDRVVAGTPTNIDSDSGTYSGGRIMVTCDGSRIRVFMGETGERLVLTMTETTYQTETGVTLQNTGTSDVHDLMVFDYFPTGARLAWLRKLEHDRFLILDSDASPSPPETYTADRDFWARFRITSIPAANSIIIHFRKKDSDDYIEIEFNDVGEVYFREVLGGSSSQIDSGSGIAVGDVIDLFAWGQNLYCYANYIQKMGVTETTHINETGFELTNAGGSISDLEIYPFP